LLNIFDIKNGFFYTISLLIFIVICYKIKFKSLILVIISILSIILIPYYSNVVNSGNWPATLKGNNINYKILIIVDEFDAVQSSKIIDKFVITPTFYYVNDRNTINTADAFIKLFFPENNLNQISPCGIKTLCDDSHIFSFDSIFNKNIDAKKLYSGFYFPGCINSSDEICKIRPLIGSPFNSLKCYINRIYKNLFVDSCQDKYKYFLDLTSLTIDDFSDFISNNKSGYIVLHVPISHPPGPTFNLKDDIEIYTENVLTFINNILILLNNNNKSFELEIISDHPLRTELWCNASFYSKDYISCLDLIGDGYGKQTPLIIWK
jgi:hypothetical protein